MSFRRSIPKQAAFTLVEVALAIGIVAFAFVALLALLPAGSTAYRRAMDLTVTGQIAQRVLNEAAETDFQTLVDDPDSAAADPVGFAFQAPSRHDDLYYRYFDDQAREIVPVDQKSLTSKEKLRMIYQVGERVITKVRLPGDPAAASGTPSSSAHSGEPSSMAQVTVQVAHNPNQLYLPMAAADNKGDDPSRRLFDPKQNARIEIFTFAEMVSRRE